VSFRLLCEEGLSYYAHFGSSPVKLKFSFHSASEARPTGSDKNPHLAYLTVVAPSADTNEVGRPVVCQPWRDLSENIHHQRSGAERHAFLKIST
jgi:hypothetical protein